MLIAQLTFNGPDTWLGSGPITLHYRNRYFGVLPLVNIGSPLAARTSHHRHQHRTHAVSGVPPAPCLTGHRSAAGSAGPPIDTIRHSGRRHDPVKTLHRLINLQLLNQPNRREIYPGSEGVSTQCDLQSGRATRCICGRRAELGR